MRAALALTGAQLRRLARDRTSLFFIVILPFVVVAVVGSVAGGFETFEVAVVDQGAGRVGERIVAAVEADDAFDVRRMGGTGAARAALRRGEVAAVVVLPDGLDEAVRAGRPARVVLHGEQARSADLAALAALRSVLDRAGARLDAAAFVRDHVGGDLGGGLAAADAAAADLDTGTVEVEVVDADARTLPEGFSYSAPTMLVLFVFITGVAGASVVIRSREVGVHGRALAAPVRTVHLVAGEGLALLAVLAGQAALLVVVGAVVFGVEWGDPVAAAALVGTWVLVGTGAGLLSGSAFRTAEQAGSVGPPLGIVLGMLGGCMWPLEIVPPVMRTIGHLTPHAWAVDAWTELLSRGGDLGDIAASLGILAVLAAVLLVLSTNRLARTLAG